MHNWTATYTCKLIGIACIGLEFDEQLIR
jgi:hypothetical protein